MAGVVTKTLPLEISLETSFVTLYKTVSIKNIQAAGYRALKNSQTSKFSLTTDF